MASKKAYDHFPTISKQRKKELIALAEKLYNKGFDIMDDVCEIYPKYNDVLSTDHESAVVEIRKRFFEKENVNEQSMNEDEYGFLANHLNCMISGGLS